MGLVALEELDHMRPSEVNQLKAITSQHYMNERAVYGRHKERRPHIASFCGTGNNPQFLNDPTGNRQFEEPNLEEELIQTYFRKPYGTETGEFLTATRIIELINSYIKTALLAKNIAFAMNKLGFEKRRVKSVRGWNVVILNGDEIKSRQRRQALESESD